MKESFSINDLAMITSLSTRTLRNYLNMGFLEGDKVNGAWTFSPEQVQAFMDNKAVRPAMRAKKNSIVLDFMSAKPDRQDKMCTILNLTAKDALSASAFFCRKISECEPEAELQFASDVLGTGVRVIISGSPRDVMDLVNGYYSQD